MFFSILQVQKTISFLTLISELRITDFFVGFRGRGRVTIESSSMIFVEIGVLYK